MRLLHEKEQREHSSKHLLWCFSEEKSYRFTIILRWLNNDKIFISEFTVLLSLSLGNIFCLYNIRRFLSFLWFFFLTTQLSDHCVWGALIIWMWIILLHSACVSPLNPAGHFRSCACGHFGSLSPAPLRVWLDLNLCQSQEVNNSFSKKERWSSNAGKRRVVFTRKYYFSLSALKCNV